MNPDPNHRIMLFRTRISRWHIWRGSLPFRRRHLQLTDRQRRAQFWIEVFALALALAAVFLWTTLLVLEHYAQTHDVGR